MSAAKKSMSNKNGPITTILFIVSNIVIVSNILIELSLFNLSLQSSIIISLLSLMSDVLFDVLRVL